MEADSPADQAGLLVGDVITGIGPYTVNGGADQFRRAVSLRQPGDTMMLTIWRSGESFEVAVAFPNELPVEIAADGASIDRASLVGEA